MKDLRFWTLVADFRFFIFAPGPRNWNSATRVQSRKSAIGVQNRKSATSDENRKSATSVQTRKSAIRVQNWKPVPVFKIENRPLGFKFIFRFWIQVANLQFSILYTCDWWQVYKKYVFHSSPSQQLVFRGEDHLHSRGASSGSASVDGNESSPYPIYENGKFLFNNLNSSPSLKFLLSLRSMRLRFQFHFTPPEHNYEYSATDRSLVLWKVHL